MPMRPLCFSPFVLFLVTFVSCSVTTNGGENKFIDGPGDKFFECKPSTVIVSASNPAVSDCIIDTGLSASLVLIQYSLSGTNIPCDTSASIYQDEVLVINRLNAHLFSLSFSNEPLNKQEVLLTFVRENDGVVSEGHVFIRIQ